MTRISTIACLLFILSGANAQGIPAGISEIDYPNNGEPLTLYTYKPPSYTTGPLIIVFHGVKRNASDYRDYAVNLAERFGAIVVAPHFDTLRFPTERYQRGGVLKDGKVQSTEKWTYAMIPGMVDFVRRSAGQPDIPYYLIGHSAGGQFLVRMAAFLPGKPERIIAANPGSDLFPTTDQPFGYGFGKLPAELSNDRILRDYLSAPLTLYLGTDDIYPRPSFDDSPEAMKQGRHRLERGRNCFTFAKELAARKGWPFNWRIVETPGIGHDAARMFAAPESKDALFGREQP
jgi:dienelactone hydrolase